MEFRKALESIWRAGVEKAGGHEAVHAGLKGIAKADGIIAVGKAATPMLEAALAHSGYDTKSLLVTKKDHVICRYKNNQARIEEYQSDGTLQVIEAGHPVPDENSLKAGKALLEFVEGMEKDSHLLVLVSGGASALAEYLPDDMDLDSLRELTRESLAEGADIAAINAKRKEFSRIKGGKLLAAFGGSSLSVLAISDVRGDDLGVIGSGIGMVDRVSASVRCETQIVATNEIARNACEKKAQMLGFDVCENLENAYGDVADVAHKIVDAVKVGRNGVYIYGGEPTVVLPVNAGEGGRNQHLALLLAKHFSGTEGVEFLVAGSDGSDGPTNSAGGFGDGHSFLAAPGGEDALVGADAGKFLAQTKNLFVTGPTGTNIMDLIILIKY